MENLFVFCDESGNTGTNLLDNNQPIFVVGGWVVPISILDQARNLVNDSLKYILSPSGELHGVELLNKKRGRKTILQLIRNLCELNCLPVSVVAEKRYVLAGTVLEIFLDPGSNPRSPRDFDFNATGKPEAADIIYNMPDAILHDFFKAWQVLDRQLLLDSLLKVCAELTIRQNTWLADMLMGCHPNIDNLINDNLDDRALLHGKKITALNLSAFVRYFQYLEELGRIGNSSRIYVTHDNIDEFNESFYKILEVYRDSDESVVHLSPQTNLFFGFKSVKELRCADSKSEPLLQAADVLVTSIQRFTVGMLKHRPIQSSLSEASNYFLPREGKYPRFMSLITSKQLLEKL